ncbi:MAG: hypothetical protein GYA55_08880 [SAR324 cluster bacterium]|uniref:Uncharacterized protein n=1 Tax=SAR324 cluster bacterium TaxID=2024889 RepID=A0A7X9FSF0_9DELT|nr:hypothetical protein [SAR324 cluster bacterium]
MLTKVTLNKELEAIAERLWPGVKSPCTFRPLIAKENGHFSSDFCVSLSSEVNLSPGIIAENLLLNLSSFEELSLKRDGNFLVLEFLPNYFDEAAFKRIIELPTVESSSIILPTYLSCSSPMAFVRVASLAFEQYLVMRSQGIHCSLYVGERKLPEGGVLEAYRHLLLEHRETEATPASDAVSYLLNAIAAAGNDQVFVWLASTSLPKDCFQEVFKKAIYKQSKRILRTPDPNWSSGSESFIAPAYITQASDDDLWSLMLYLGSPLQADELDLFVPRFFERENLVWFLKSLVERIRKIEVEPLKSEKEGLCSACDATILPRLGLYRAQYPFLLSRVCTHAEVELFNDALRQIALSLSVSLNQPALRQALRANIEHSGAEIIYSLSRIFSVIMSLNQAESLFK